MVYREIIAVCSEIHKKHINTLFGTWGGVVVKALCSKWTCPGSIPGGVTGFFSDVFPSDRTMALGSTQPQVKMSTRNIS